MYRFPPRPAWLLKAMSEPPESVAPGPVRPASQAPKRPSVTALRVVEALNVIKDVAACTSRLRQTRRGSVGVRPHLAVGEIRDELLESRVLILKLLQPLYLSRQQAGMLLRQSNAERSRRSRIDQYPLPDPAGRKPGVMSLSIRLPASVRKNISGLPLQPLTPCSRSTRPRSSNAFTAWFTEVSFA